MNRPLISFVLLAYNQENYIKQAIKGALAQTYSPMEIVLSDDCSPDGTYVAMQEAIATYTGPHKIILNRNPTNLRLAGHVNRCMEIASGEIIVLAAGDDISLPERAAKSVELLSNGAMAISFSTQEFNNDSDLTKRAIKEFNEPRLKTYSWKAYIQNSSFHLNGAARSFRRELFERFGGIEKSCPTEDSVLLLRALLLGEVIESEEIMVRYRVHGNNLSFGESFRKMDFGIIHDQYCKDLKRALASELISNCDFDELSKALLVKRDRINAINAIESAKGKFSDYVNLIMFSNAVKLRSKLKLFMKLMLYR